MWAVSVWPRIGLYFAKIKFCWMMWVRMIRTAPLYNIFCSLSLAAFLSDTKDRGPPVQSQAWRSGEKVPFGQIHYLRAFEKAPQVQTQALRDFEKVSPMGG